MPDAITGLSLIAAERRRQQGELGYTPEHDAMHDDGALADAAAWYALTPKLRAGVSERTQHTQTVVLIGDLICPAGFILRGNTDRIRELQKAGALIAAELDRLLRAALDA